MDAVALDGAIPTIECWEDMGTVVHTDTVEHSENEKIQNSPVLNALRSHIEKWYPETAKNNKLEVEDMVGEDMPYKR